MHPYYSGDKMKCLDWSFCLKAFGDTLYKNVKGFFVGFFFVGFFGVVFLS